MGDGDARTRRLCGNASAPPPSLGIGGTPGLQGGLIGKSPRPSCETALWSVRDFLSKAREAQNDFAMPPGGRDVRCHPHRTRCHR